MTDPQACAALLLQCRPLLLKDAGGVQHTACVVHADKAMLPDLEV